MAWAEAADGAVASHRRDLPALLPTAASHMGAAAAPPAILQPSSGAIHRLPTLLEASDVPRRTRCCATTADLVPSLEAIAQEAQRLFRETDFRFLFVPTRKLFSIGFRVRDSSLDPNCYDLLASEARLASFLAIAKGDVEASPLVPARPPADARSAAAPRWSPGPGPCSST